MLELETFRSFIFARFEYVTKPMLKILEAPLIDVMLDDSIPPVQDSATEIDNFFFYQSLDYIFNFKHNLKL